MKPASAEHFPMLQPWMNPADLAPGDAKSAAADWEGFELHRIRSTDHPMFRAVFGTLWTEFGEKGEIEQPEIIERRMAWDAAQLLNGCALRYELLAVTREGALVGVRDHTAIVRPEFGTVVVHMSHNLVLPEWRRGGIAGWLRALPAECARECLRRRGLPLSSPICLVGEMEPADPANETRMIRLRAYEKAGYRKVDPAEIAYLQPDFRAPAEIDATGGAQPLPLCLLVRFVGEEERSSLPADEVRGIVASLYRMYAAGFREQDMAAVYASLESYPEGPGPLRLLPPTALS